jgi:hypothetical protein
LLTQDLAHLTQGPLPVLPDVKDLKTCSMYICGQVFPWFRQEVNSVLFLKWQSRYPLFFLESSL